MEEDAQDESVTKDQLERLYALRVMNWLDWRAAGRIFIGTARTLAKIERDHLGDDWQSVSSGTVIPYAVCYAIGVEDLLKALVVKRRMVEGEASGLELVKANGTLGSALKTHHARTLWKNAKPKAELTPPMGRLLDWLTDLRVAGGYPAPVGVDKNPRHLYDEFPRLADRIEELVELLELELPDPAA